MRNKLPAKKSIGVDLDSKVIEQWRKTEPCMCELAAFPGAVNVWWINVN